MSKSNDLYWADQNRKLLKEKYLSYLKGSGLENTFDNCYDFIRIECYSINLKKEFGVPSDVELSKRISGQEPNDYSF
jgi:hypothetical protein